MAELLIDLFFEHLPKFAVVSLASFLVVGNKVSCVDILTVALLSTLFLYLYNMIFYVEGLDAGEVEPEAEESNLIFTTEGQIKDLRPGEQQCYYVGCDEYRQGGGGNGGSGNSGKDSRTISNLRNGVDGDPDQPGWNEIYDDIDQTDKKSIADGWNKLYALNQKIEAVYTGTSDPGACVQLPDQTYFCKLEASYGLPKSDQCAKQVYEKLCNPLISY